MPSIFTTESAGNGGSWYLVKCKIRCHLNTSAGPRPVRLVSTTYITSYNRIRSNVRRIIGVLLITPGQQRCWLHRSVWLRSLPRRDWLPNGGWSSEHDGDDKSKSNSDGELDSFKQAAEFVFLNELLNHDESDEDDDCFGCEDDSDDNWVDW